MDIVRQSLAITFVFGLLWLALWLLRRRGSLRVGFPRGRSSPGLLESRGRLSLSPQHSVFVIRAGKRDLVVATHPAGVTLLCELAPGESIATPEAAL